MSKRRAEQSLGLRKRATRSTPLAADWPVEPLPAEIGAHRIPSPNNDPLISHTCVTLLRQVRRRCQRRRVVVHQELRDFKRCLGECRQDDEQVPFLAFDATSLSRF